MQKSLSTTTVQVSGTLFLVLLVLMPCVVQAKRAAPPKIDPVVSGGVRYVVPNDNGRKAYVQARDLKTNKLLWESTIFRNVIDPLMEEDVQCIYIRSMTLKDAELVLGSEDGRIFILNLKTRSVEKIGKITI